MSDKFPGLERISFQIDYGNGRIKTFYYVNRAYDGDSDFPVFDLDAEEVVEIRPPWNEEKWSWFRAQPDAGDFFQVNTSDTTKTTLWRFKVGAEPFEFPPDAVFYQ